MKLVYWIISKTTRDEECLAILSCSKTALIRLNVAKNKHCPIEVLCRLSEDKNKLVKRISREKILSNGEALASKGITILGI